MEATEGKGKDQQNTRRKRGGAKKEGGAELSHPLGKQRKKTNRRKDGDWMNRHKLANRDSTKGQCLSDQKWEKYELRQGGGAADAKNVYWEKRVEMGKMEKNNMEIALKLGKEEKEGISKNEENN